MRQLGILVFLLLAATASAADWPQFRGLNRDGVATTAPPLVTDLPSTGLPERWSHPVGNGFAGPVVSGESVLIFHRVENEAVLDCLEPTTGKQRWTFTYPTNYRDDFGFDPGPRSPPTVTGDTVLTYGAEGMLSAVSLADGTLRWQHDLSEEFSAPKGFFGRAGAPLVIDQHVLLNIGGKTPAGPAGVVAFRISDGSLAWQATSHEASYSSPVTLGLGGRPVALFLTRDGLLALDPKQGDVLGEAAYRPRINASVNAASPVQCSPGTVFLSTCYGVGGSLWSIAADATPKELWRREGVLDAHYATPVYTADHLFGFHGRQESGTELRCVAPADGAVRWSSDELASGQLIAAGEHLIVLTEDGELALTQASPDAFEMHWRTQVFRRPSRCIPAFSDGLVFARGPRRVACFDLRIESP